MVSCIAYLFQLERIQAQLESGQAQLTEKIQNLERANQAAIEYNVSSDSHSSFQQPPSLAPDGYDRSPSKPHYESLRSRSPRKNPGPSKSEELPRAKTTGSPSDSPSKAHVRLERSCDNIGPSSGDLSDTDSHKWSLHFVMDGIILNMS